MTNGFGASAVGLFVAGALMAIGRMGVFVTATFVDGFVANGVDDPLHPNNATEGNSARRK